MKAIIEAAARHPVFPNLLMVMIILGGLWGFLDVRRESYPEVKIDMVQIQVPYPGASSLEIEEGIVSKIENELKGVQGIKVIKGIAMEGTGLINVELQGDDIARTTKDIKDKVEQISTLPQDSEPPQISEIVMDDPAVWMLLHGSAPERTLRELAFDIKDELAELGATQVVLGGIRNYEMTINVSRNTLQSYNLTLAQVANVIRKSSVNLPSGSIRTKSEEYKIEVRGRVYSSDEYKRIVIVSREDGTVIRLGQIAEVIDGFEDNQSEGRYNGETAVMLTVNKGAGGDTIVVAQKVKDYLDQKELPYGMQLSIMGDFSNDVNDRIGLLVTNAWQGLLLLFFALWFFLDLKLSIWVTVGIPISFAFTGIVMGLGGHTLNMISLFGLILVLGIVVDDAIVIGENVHVYQQRGMAPLDAAIAATAEVAWPVVAAVTTTVLAFMPLFFVAGVMGKFIAIMPIVVVATLIGSVIEGLLILPAHLGHGSHEPESAEKKESFGQKMRNKIETGINFVIYNLYKPLYSQALTYRYVTIAVVLTVAMGTFGLITGGTVPVILFDKSDTVYLQANIAFPEGTPHEVTKAAIADMEAALTRVNDKYADRGKTGKIVNNVFSEIGRGGKVNAGQMVVNLVGSENRSMHSEEVINAWRSEVGDIANVDTLKFISVGGLKLPVQDIQLFLVGENISELNKAAGDVQNTLRSYAGVFDVESDLKSGKRELHVELKPQGVALGITLQDLATQLREGFFGAEALKVQRGRDEVKIQVRFPENERAALSDLYKVRIRTSANVEVPFVEVAEIKQKRGMAEILHRNGKRRAQILASVDPKVTTSTVVMNDLKNNVLPKLRAQYPNITISSEGADAEGAESVNSLIAAFGFAAMGIYMVLAVVFRSYLQPLLIMVTIPLGLVGAVLGHYVMSYALTMLSLFGVIALAGVVVNDSLVLIDRINQKQRDGASVFESVLDAGPSRFRAIVLTSVTTVAGLLPLLAEKSFQAQDLQPMALSLAAGLIFATVLTLFLIPCLYLALNDLRRVFGMLTTRKWPTAEAVEPIYAENSH